MYGHLDPASREEIALFDWSQEDEETRREFLEVHVVAQPRADLPGTTGPRTPIDNNTRVQVLGATRAAGVTHTLVSLRGEPRTSWTRAREGTEPRSSESDDYSGSEGAPPGTPIDRQESPQRDQSWQGSSRTEQRSDSGEGMSGVQRASSEPRERRFGGTAARARVVRRGRTRSRTKMEYERAGLDPRALRSPEFIDRLPAPRPRGFGRGATETDRGPRSEGEATPRASGVSDR